MVSVIVPVYNNEKYIGECIESILQQTYKDFELILVNDGSTDRSLDVCNNYIQDKRIIVVDKKNEGVSATRNVGISKSRAKYITFVDSDDTIEPFALELLLSEMESKNVDFVAARRHNLYSNKKVPHPTRHKAGIVKTEDIINDYIDDGELSGFYIGSSCGALFKKKIIDEYNITFQEEIRINEDGLFDYEYVMHTKSIAFIDQCIYNARKHGTNSSGRRPLDYNFNKQIKDYLYQKYANGVELNFELQFRRRSVSVALWNLLIYTKYFPLLKAYHFVNEIVNSNEVCQNISTIKSAKLSGRKKCFFFLMKHKCILALCIITKFILPNLPVFLRK